MTRWADDPTTRRPDDDPVTIQIKIDYIVFLKRQAKNQNIWNV